MQRLQYLINLWPDAKKSRETAIEIEKNDGKEESVEIGKNAGKGVRKLPW